jgi:6-pyruvoyltetrahydropterin/6-carboxytetrahydropterin synthase
MYEMTREIGIDAAHRVQGHGSKCRGRHGHRYRIVATCSSIGLRKDGEQSSMVLDFGFLKRLMMNVIDTPCDHGFIISVQDLELLRNSILNLDAEQVCGLGPNEPKETEDSTYQRVSVLDAIEQHVDRVGFWSSLSLPLFVSDKDYVFEPEVFDRDKLYVVPGITTAEYLAEHWFKRLRDVIIQDQGVDLLASLTVWETPNCSATYRPDRIEKEEVASRLSRAFMGLQKLAGKKDTHFPRDKDDF